MRSSTGVIDDESFDSADAHNADIIPTAITQEDKSEFSYYIC